MLDSSWLGRCCLMEKGPWETALTHQAAEPMDAPTAKKVTEWRDPLCIWQWCQLGKSTFFFKKKQQLLKGNKAAQSSLVVHIQCKSGSWLQGSTECLVVFSCLFTSSEWSGFLLDWRLEKPPDVNSIVDFWAALLTKCIPSWPIETDYLAGLRPCHLQLDRKFSMKYESDEERD